MSKPIPIIVTSYNQETGEPIIKEGAMSRVDHWADVRDRSIGELDTVPASLEYENANLKVKIGRMAAQIFQLKENLKEREEEVVFIRSLQNDRIKMTARDLLMEIAKKHDITPMNIMGPSMSREVVQARQEAMWRLKHELQWSHCQIGRMFDKDHSTVAWGVKAHAKRLRKIEEHLMSREKECLNS